MLGFLQTYSGADTHLLYRFGLGGEMFEWTCDEDNELMRIVHVSTELMTLLLLEGSRTISKDQIRMSWSLFP